jgi:hypothetical protein
VNAPNILKDGTKVRIREKLQAGKIEVQYVYQTWDFRHLSIGLKVGRGEPIADFWHRLQAALKEEIEPVNEYHA